MDKKKGIKDRLTCISVLLKEIEDIICERKRETQQSSLINASPICECGQESRSTDEKLLVQTKHNNKEKYCKKKKMKNVDSEKCLRSLELCPDDNNNALNFPKNNKKCHEKNKLKILREKKRNTKKDYNTREEYNAKEFKCNLNDMKQKIMLYFDDINKN